jgi:hypothetical protein
VDGVDGDRVATVVERGGGILVIEQALVVGRVVLLVEAGREAKVGELDVAVLVNEDIIGFDVAA